MLDLLSPLISLFIFMLGNGFFATLLALKMSANGAPDLLIGAMTGIFYAGLVVGSFRIEVIILRIGHIRAYAAFASGLAVLNMLCGIIDNNPLLLLIRFLGGLATAGVFVVLESWLLCQPNKRIQGQVLALYMISFYLAQALGQFFINLGSPQSLLLFSIVSMTSSLSVIPLSMMRVKTPNFDEPSTLSFRKLYQSSASGLAGCLVSGLLMGVIYGLSPVFYLEIFEHKTHVAEFMFSMIFGGMLLQYPVGKISDLIERRLVLIGICIGTIVLIITTILVSDDFWLFFFLTGVLGGLLFTIYPVSISHACDTLASKDIVAGTQSLLLVYSVGAMIGPLIAPVFMYAFGLWGLYIYFIVVCVLLLPWLIWRKAHKQDTPQEDPFISLPQTSALMSELDPRGDTK